MNCNCEICTSEINLFYTGDKMPCNCKTRYMHCECLGEWVKTRRQKQSESDLKDQKHMSCEVCNTRYFN